MPRRRPEYVSGLTVSNIGAGFTDDERVFLLAMERYIRTTGRKFPAWTEVLAVAESLGYRLVEKAGPLPRAK